MKAGSVIVDLAAEQGGNCELTVPGRGRAAARRHDHRLHGSAEPAGRAVEPAVRARTCATCSTDMCPKKDGSSWWTSTTKSCAAPPSSRGTRSRGRRPRRSCRRAAAKRRREARETSRRRREAMKTAGSRHRSPTGADRRARRCSASARWRRRSSWRTSRSSCWRASSATWSIWNVTPALHTPLMSVTNAISSIIIIGALLQISSPAPADRRGSPP